jgi:antitoxin MazE
MQSSVKKFGNSAGVVIPKPLLTEIGARVGDNVDMSLQDGRIVIEFLAKKNPREGWAEDAARLVAEGDADLVWPDFVDDVDDNWTW